MATAKYVQLGREIDYKAENDIAYRDIVPLDSRIGVACAAIPKGEIGAISLTGVYEMPAAVGAIKVGAVVYYDPENENITATEKKDTTIIAGVAAAPKTEAATTCFVRID